jgi:hypothetical protein
MAGRQTWHEVGSAATPVNLSSPIYKHTHTPATATSPVPYLLEVDDLDLVQAGLQVRLRVKRRLRLLLPALVHAVSRGDRNGYYDE